MSLFSSKTKYSLGIDFGTQSIKAVELKMVDNKIQLSNYGWVNVTNVKETPDEFDSDYAERLKEALKELLAQMKPNTKKATVAIPSFNGLVMIVDFPKMSEKDVENAMKFEARKYIPVPIEEVNVSWEILKSEEDENESPEEDDEQMSLENGGQEEFMKVLIAAAPKSEVQYYDDLFENLKTSINVLELESFALIRSIIGTTKGRFVLVDFGAKTTNVVLVNDGVIVVNRSVDIGGVNITNAIMQGMNVSREKAVSLKESGENFFTGAAKIGFPSLNYVSNEIKKVMESQQNNKIEALVLCGGGSELIGLPEYLNKLTGLKVVKGNSLNQISYDKNNSGKIEELEGLLNVAIGLAMREFEDV